MAPHILFHPTKLKPPELEQFLGDCIVCFVTGKGVPFAMFSTS